MTPKRPYRALFAGILVPGAGHAYAGDRRGALRGFAVVTALFVVGALLASPRIFAFSAHPFAGSSSLLGSVLSFVPLHLWPEVGNLVETAVLWATQPPLTPEHSRLLRLPLEYEQLGLMLTGMAGALNFFVAADACWLVARDNLAAERGRTLAGRPALDALAAWLVPGLGHWRLGLRPTAAVVGGALAACWLLGLWFSGFAGCDRAQLYWWWAAQSGLGGLCAVTTPLLGPVAVAADVPTMDLGVTLLSVAGLLNLAVVTDVYSRSERRALEAAGIVGASTIEEAGA
ncbi:MAG: DUF6677 family protein [Planctomycetota bacterium]